MRRVIYTVAMLCITATVFSQTNTFPGSGNVGIGTISPGVNLDIKEVNSVGLSSTSVGSYAIPTIRILNPNTSDGDVGGFLAFDVAGGRSIAGIGGGKAGANNDASQLVFYTHTSATGPQENMILTQEGRLGLGTHYPSARLHVHGSVKFGGLPSSAVIGKVLTAIDNNGTLDWMNLPNNNLWDETSGNVHRVSGNVGIGISSPSEKLHIKGVSPIVNIEGEHVTAGAAGGNRSGISFTGGTNVYGAYREISPYGDFFEIGEQGAITSNITIWNNNVGIGSAGVSVLANSSGSANVVIGGKTWINSELAIGSTSKFATGALLSVAGKAYFEEVEVQLSGSWPDYVFDANYELASLKSVSDFVKLNSHLPEVPSASQIEEEGINVAEMQAVLLKKIEELTLYTIQQQEEIEKLNRSLSAIEK